jgi:hypothetical protein
MKLLLLLALPLQLPRHRRCFPLGYVVLLRMSLCHLQPGPSLTHERAKKTKLPNE